MNYVNNTIHRREGLRKTELIMKVFLKTFGCTFNKFDSELIKYALENRGYKLTCKIEEADIVIVNTCGVKKQTEDRVISYLRRVSLPGKMLVVTGCLPLINPERVRVEVNPHVMVGASIGGKIVDLIEGRISQKELLRNDLMPALNQRRYNCGVIHITPIAHGCLGECSYCAVKLARGRLRSYRREDIIADVKNALSHGAKEIWLTAQDTGVYGLDLGDENLIKLLREVLELRGRFYVRLGMINPLRLIRILDELIELFRTSDKLFRFLHIPVQSGSDEMLKVMKRPYEVEDFIEIADRLRREVDGKFNIATDIIVGHPGETDRDFEETIKLMKRVEPDIVNISKFFPRPGTEAKRMKQIASQVIKERSVFLTKICEEISLRRNREWIGWQGEVLVDELGKNKTFISRNLYYKSIVLKNELELGGIHEVRVMDAKPYWLYGRLMNESF